MTRFQLASAAAFAVATSAAVILGCSKSDKTPVTPTNQFTITASAGAGGVIAPTGNVVVPRDSSQTFHIALTTGTSINTVLVDGVNQGADSVYTFHNVSANHTIAATFNGAGPEVFDSGALSTVGASFSHVFATGSPYYCQFHAAVGMTGTVNVSGAGADSALVTVSSNVFTPSSVTVKPGGTVRWVWNGGFHTVTSGTPPAGRAGMKPMPGM